MFFLLELNWQLTLCSILAVSNHSSAGCSFHQMSPPHRGSSCTLHSGCAPCTLGSAGEVGWGSCLSVWGSSTADSSHKHTHTETHTGKHLLSLSLDFTLSHSEEATETAGWGVRDGDQWVLSGGGNLTGLPTRWKHSVSLPLLLPLFSSFIHLSFACF